MGEERHSSEELGEKCEVEKPLEVLQKCDRSVWQGRAKGDLDSNGFHWEWANCRALGSFWLRGSSHTSSGPPASPALSRDVSRWGRRPHSFLGLLLHTTLLGSFPGRVRLNGLKDEMSEAQGRYVPHRQQNGKAPRETRPPAGLGRLFSVALQSAELCLKEKPRGELVNEFRSSL